MKIPQLLTCAALAAAFSVTLPAQQALSGFHSVTCLKVKPENNTEFRKWAAEDVHKYAQSRVDAGAFSEWIMLRAVIPTGQSAECDYLIVSVYPGIPPEPLDLEELAAALKKAGITASAQQYVDRRNALTTLISNDMFQNMEFVGGSKKGESRTQEARLGRKPAWGGLLALKCKQHLLDADALFREVAMQQIASQSNLGLSLDNLVSILSLLKRRLVLQLNQIISMRTGC